MPGLANVHRFEDDAPPSPLTEALLQGLDPRLADAVTAPVEAALATVAEQARAAYPEVRLAPELFVRHLGSLIRPGAELAAELNSLHTADLYLATACASLEPAALAHFDRRLLNATGRSLTHLSPSSSFADEVRQTLRERLLSAQEPTPPRILEYSGRGPLEAWLGVAALRIALNLRRGEERRAAAEDALVDLPSPASNPELDLLRGRYRTEFRDAFGLALQALSSKQRNLLRLHQLDGLTHEQLAAHYRVHRVTVGRWLQAACEALVAETRRRLGEALGDDGDSLESVIALLRSNLDLSLGRLLRRTEERP